MPLQRTTLNIDDRLSIAKRPFRPRGRAILVISMICFAILIATFSLFNTAQEQQRLRTEQLLSVEAKSFADALTRHMNAHLNELSVLASEIERNIPSTYSTWQALVQAHQGNDVHFQALFWAESDRTIRWHYPQSDAEKPEQFPFDVLGDGNAQLLRMDVESLHDWHIAHPIYTQNRNTPDYYLGGTLDIAEHISHLASDYLDTFQKLTLYAASDGHVVFGDIPPNEAATGQVGLTLTGASPEFIVTLWNSPDSEHFLSLPMLIYISGLVVTILVGIALYLIEINLMARKAEQATITRLQNEIAQRKDVENQLHFIANHDPLTYLPNRHALLNHIQHTINKTLSATRTLSLICIDIDNIKEINDLHGYRIHDDVLTTVAKRLQNLLPPQAYLARTSDEHFVMLRTDLSPLEAEVHAKQVRLTVEKECHAQGVTVLPSCAIGVAYRYDTSMPAHELLRHADTAAHRARQLVHHRVVVFQMAMRDHLQQKRDIEYTIRKAIQGNELMLHFQPQVDLKTQRIVGIEALVRWQDEGGTIISPDTIVRTAEDTGLMQQLGNWIINKALEHYAMLLTEGCAPPMLAINVSGHEFQDSFLADTILQAIERHQVPAERVQIELTEQVFIENLEQNQQTLHTLTEAGISLAIDDFGTGYSSLAYLKHFPVDTVKIDRSFIDQLPECKDDAVICQAVIGMADLLGLKVVAEGVEHQAQKDYLAQIGCRYIQGHLYYPAMGVDQLLTLLKQHIPYLRYSNS